MSEVLRKNFRQYRVFEQLNKSGHIESGILEKLQSVTKVIVAEKSWEGIDGLEITPEVTITIAAQAGVMLLGVDGYYFDNVNTVLVSPNTLQRQFRDGLIVHEDQHFSGMAYRDGKVLLSWHDVIRGGRSSDDAQNVVIHEFAHCLDNIDGNMAGDVIFPSRQSSERWLETVDREFEQLRNDKESGRRNLLDDYGATNKAEFFAVSAETFFERPEKLKKSHAALFSLLVEYFRLDPIDWRIVES